MPPLVLVLGLVAFGAVIIYEAVDVFRCRGLCQDKAWRAFMGAMLLPMLLVGVLSFVRGVGIGGGAGLVLGSIGGWGVVLLVRGERAKWRARHRPPDHCCQVCGYDLRGLNTKSCPECGDVRRWLH